MVSTNAGLMLGQRHRRWPNINPALAQLAGYQPFDHQVVLFKFSPTVKLWFAVTKHNIK